MLTAKDTYEKLVELEQKIFSYYNNKQNFSEYLNKYEDLQKMWFSFSEEEKI